MATCAECGTTLAAGSAACPACGVARGGESRECPNCEERIAADAGACPACGHLLEREACASHPERAAEGRCAICGRALCAEECDQGPGATYLCDVHAEIPVIEGWAQVYTTGNEIEAQLIQSNLGAEGIEARVFSQKDHAFAVGMGDLSPVRLLVPAYAYLEAAELIRQHMDREGELEFACPECGEPYDTAQASCDACGAALAGRGAG